VVDPKYLIIMAYSTRITGAATATIMCLVFFLLIHDGNRNNAAVELQISSLKASIQSLESEVLHLNQVAKETRNHTQYVGGKAPDVVYAGHLELPEHQPFLPYTLFGRQVQIADYSRGHIDQVLREVQDEGFYNLALNAISPGEGEGKTVIDIGGNFGAFSMGAKITAPKVKLLTFEAVPSNCANLKANMETNGFTNNWIFTCGALGSSDGDILHFSVDKEHSGGASSVYKNPITDPSLHDGRHMFYDVVSSKLDTMLEKYNVKHVHALKIDCEGCEYDTLKNSKRIKDIDVVVAEFHINSHLRSQGHSFENLKSFLRSQNPKIIIYSTDIHMHDVKKM
jgi:FkbM family methyltransferase